MAQTTPHLSAMFAYTRTSYYLFVNDYKRLVNDNLPVIPHPLKHLCIFLLFHLKSIIMSSLRNKVQLIGNVGNAPEITAFESGKKKATLSVATNENYKNKTGEKITDTQWHRVIAWDGTANIIEQFVRKGSHIAIEGKLTSRSFLDSEGKKQFITEVTAHQIQLLNKKEA